MYVLAVADGCGVLANRIVRQLLTNGVAAVATLDGVDMAVASRHKPERQVGAGDDWILWHEPPFGELCAPPEDVVLAWVRDVADEKSRAVPDA